MLFKRSPGTRCEVRYRKGSRLPLQHRAGEVVAAGRGPGPRNVLVRLDDGTRVVVPVGNLTRSSLR